MITVKQYLKIKQKYRRISILSMVKNGIIICVKNEGNVMEMFVPKGCSCPSGLSVWNLCADIFQRIHA